MTALACEFVKKWEGCELKAYQDQGGVWTIGIGHTGTDVTPDTVWTQDRADKVLQADMDAAIAAVHRHVGSGLTPNQEAALGSFVFNLGEGAFSKSTLLRRVNEGDHIGAVFELLKWHHIGTKPVKGLLRRRLDEAALFLKP